MNGWNRILNKKMLSSNLLSHRWTKYIPNFDIFHLQKSNIFLLLSKWKELLTTWRPNWMSWILAWKRLSNMLNKMWNEKKKHWAKFRQLMASIQITCFKVSKFCNPKSLKLLKKLQPAWNRSWNKISNGRPKWMPFLITILLQWKNGQNPIWQWLITLVTLSKTTKKNKYNPFLPAFLLLTFCLEKNLWNATTNLTTICFQ